MCQCCGNQILLKHNKKNLETLFETRETALHILVMNVEALSTEKGVKIC